jgi:hypothetical protein
LRLCKACVDGRYLVLWVFFIALIIRALPEFLSGSYPVGYDLLAGYAPSILAFPDFSPLKLFGWAWSPLAVFVLWFFWRLSGLDLYFFLKVAGPVFYGSFVLSFYYLLSKGMRWSGKKSFVTALIFLLQPAVLRTGWDQLREQLGLTFLFVLLAWTNCDVVAGAKSKPLTVIVLSVLIVFSHQLAAILFFVVVLWQMFEARMRRDGSFLKAFLVVVPSAGIFVWQLYGQFVNPGFSAHFAPIQLPSGTSNFIFTNYFMSDPRFLGGNYFTVLGYVGFLSLYAVVPLIPVAWKGVFRDRVLAPMLVWLSVVSYSILAYPWYAFAQYWWWTLLLPIPLTVYLGERLERLNVFTSSKRFKITVAGLILLGVIGVDYATSIIRIGYPYAYSYMPSGLVESAMPFEDISDLKKALEWVNQNASFSFSVIVEEKFQGIAYTELRTDIRILVAPSLMKLSDVFKITDKEVSLPCFVVYYTNNAGEYNQYRVVSFGKIGIYLMD